MEQYEYIAPCHFGLEAVLKREILDLGYEIVQVEDGKVTFRGDIGAICRANIFLRTTERILLKVAKFRATTFEELFEKTKQVPWEKYIPEDGKFWVAKATSIKSKLFSPSDIQSIMKKAMVEIMKQRYKKDWFSEDGSEYPLRVTFMKDDALPRPRHRGRLLPRRPLLLRAGRQAPHQRERRALPLPCQHAHPRAEA